MSAEFGQRIPEWARKRSENWEKIPGNDQIVAEQTTAFEERRRKRVSQKKSVKAEEKIFEDRPFRDGAIRKKALDLVREEKQKPNDRLTVGHSERGRRARSPEERREEKSQEGIPVSERAWRLGILLRTGAYDRNKLKKLPDIVRVPMRRWQESNVGGNIGVTDETHDIPKQTLEAWRSELKEYELQRLYVIGRKKMEFPFRESDYPQWVVRDDDSSSVRAWKQAKMEGERRFQKEQKELADALEVVAIPVLKGVFDVLGVSVDVYLSGLPDDLAGGIDVIIEFKDQEGNQKKFSDGTPMTLVIDVTYARMRDKISKEMNRGRVCDDAYDILKGESGKIPPELSNARAMKLFRTVVEMLEGSMSTQTFGKDAPLEKRREHIPRLIIGFDWENAFSLIANWVVQGDAFEDFFKGTGLARRTATSIRKQLAGLHALSSLEAGNPNTIYISELMREIGTESLKQMTPDDALNNLDNLLTTDKGLNSGKRYTLTEKELKQLTWRKKTWRLRQRFVEAALAQVAHNRARGGNERGDIQQNVKEGTAHVPVDAGESLKDFLEKHKGAFELLRTALGERKKGGTEAMDEIRAAAERGVEKMRAQLAEPYRFYYTDAIRSVFEEEGVTPPPSLLKSESDPVRSGEVEGGWDTAEAASAAASRRAEYLDGIHLGRQEPYVTAERPSEDAEKVLRNIQRAWERSYIAHEGEHAGYRVVKEGQKEIFWGDFVHNKMQNLSGKEQEYIKDHLPQSNQPQDGKSINERDNFSATEPRVVVVGGGEKESSKIVQDPDGLSGSPQERIAKLREKIEGIKRDKRIREVREKIERRLQKS